MLPRGLFTKFGSPQIRLVLKRCKLLNGHFHTGSASLGNDALKSTEQSVEQQESQQEKELATQEIKLKDVGVISPEQQITGMKKEIPVRDLRKDPVDNRILPKKVVMTEVEKKYFKISEYLFQVAGMDGKNKENFLKAIAIYEEREGVYHRGLAEFIVTGAELMKDWGVHKDKEVYKALLSLMPVGRYIPQSMVMAELGHYPKQQQCAIDLLEIMSKNAVIPDEEMSVMIQERFSRKSYVQKKFDRMMFWMPKFRHASPYPIPWELPKCPVQLASIALQRMTIDLNSQVTVWQTADMEESPLEDTFIASSQSEEQKEMLLSHPTDVPLVVEGGYSVWLRDKQQTYFILKSDLANPHKPPGDEMDDSEVDWTGLNPYLEERAENQSILTRPSIHTQDDCTVMATCITGTSTRNSVVTWIRYLQQENPALENIPVLFSIKTHTGQLELLENVEEKIPQTEIRPKEL